MFVVCLFPCLGIFGFCLTDSWLFAFNLLTRIALCFVVCGILIACGLLLCYAVYCNT